MSVCVTFTVPPVEVVAVVNEVLVAVTIANVILIGRVCTVVVKVEEVV